MVLRREYWGILWTEWLRRILHDCIVQRFDPVHGPVLHVVLLSLPSATTLCYPIQENSNSC